jgi:hypothetical protein
MDPLIAQSARQQLAAMDTALAVYRAGLVSFTRLGEMHLAVAGATLSETSAGALRFMAARTPEEAASGLTDDLQPQIARLYLYGCILREINRQVRRGALAAMPRPEERAE